MNFNKKKIINRIKEIDKKYLIFKIQLSYEEIEEYNYLMRKYDFFEPKEFFILKNNSIESVKKILNKNTFEEVIRKSEEYENKIKNEPKKYDCEYF